MLAQLTNFLFLHRKVAIPEIGCFELHLHGAQLDFAEKRIHPPYYSIQFSRADEVGAQQLSFLQHQAISEEDLLAFGRALKQKATVEDVAWAGVGTIFTQHGKLSFQPRLANTLLQPVEAHKVIRHQQEHAVLRGETEFSSTDLRQQKASTAKRSYFVLVAEILALLALLFIIYYFYTKGFQPLSTGNQHTIEVNPGK